MSIIERIEWNYQTHQNYHEHHYQEPQWESWSEQSEATFFEREIHDKTAVIDTPEHSGAWSSWSEQNESRISNN